LEVRSETKVRDKTVLETSLYAPVKKFLEGLGFAVKGEIGGCDLIALNGDSPPVVVVCELKLQFNLELVLQGVDRMAASDEVWLAARLSARGKGRESDARFRNLWNKLGCQIAFGLRHDPVPRRIRRPDDALPSPRFPERRLARGVPWQTSCLQNTPQEFLREPLDFTIWSMVNGGANHFRAGETRERLALRRGARNVMRLALSRADTG
jgi:hypothetical protein